MIGVSFGSKHSYTNYGLIRTSINVSAPATKTNMVDLPAADGSIDLTEVFGEPKFKNRTITMNFQVVYNSLSNFLAFWSTLQNDLNGQKMNIVLDDDVNYFYIGRLSLSYTKNKNIYSITIKADCEPYKYKVTKTIKTITSSGTITLTNSRKRVVPNIKVTGGSANLTFKGTSYQLSAGEWIIPEIELTQGNNSISVTSSSSVTVKFEYQEGDL